jgi:adenylate cyclase
MSRKTISLSIVFADISGSTRLYETLGDALARELVAKCLTVMTEQVKKYGGTVIKTIGDEIMCTFPTADKAVESAMGMQDAVTEELPERFPNLPTKLSIRVGLHFGPAIMEGGDVFGDAVNVAARMAGLAKGGQIITTQETAEALVPALRASTRHLDRIPVKGKSETIDIFEVVWQPEDVTRIATGLLSTSKTKKVTLVLRYQGKELTLDKNSGPTILGRGQKADLMVNDTMASREHARIEYRRDKFVITDQSTNGTYILGPDGQAYLRREEAALAGSGKISLGRDFKEANNVVLYECGG